MTDMKIKRLYTMKLEIQKIEKENKELKEQWRKLGEKIRQNSQDISTKKMLFIVTGFEMEEIKRHSERLVAVLPENPETALVMITFLKQHMEEVIGRKVENIKIIENKGDCR